MSIQAIYVEDEPDIAALLKNILLAINVPAKTYPQAESLLDDRESPEVVNAKLFIFDVRMPGMNGLELAAKLRSDGERRPILIVSAFQPPSEKELQALNAKFHPKPFDFPTLTSTIRKLIAASP
jgi:DNA-binding response OmpR family regulator